MNNGTTNPTPEQAECPVWCDIPAGHAGEHDGEADFPKITATADRQAFLSADDGVSVPEVVARLIRHDEPTTVHPVLRVALAIVHPNEAHASSASCHLTLDEAALLRKHLTGLLRDAGMEVAW